MVYIFISSNTYTKLAYTQFIYIGSLLIERESAYEFNTDSDTLV